MASAKLIDHELLNEAYSKEDLRISSIILNRQDQSEGLDPHNVDFQVFPNPISDHFNLNFELLFDGMVRYQLLDARGNRIFDRAEDLLAGKHNIHIDTKGLGLERAVYFIQMQIDGKRVTKRILLL